MRPSILHFESRSALLIQSSLVPPSRSLIEAKSYRDALALIESLLKELKRLDDKMILTEVYLLESRANAETANWAKAKVRRGFLSSFLISSRLADPGFFRRPL